ncbi:MAG: ferrous iron transport protein B [Eubacteriales bacterium]|nr:ferrous iron transport protein B [Eubacteriales bacterium]MDD4474482.1 ferrous iron transport protein B [Eubacteriales bacterium]
MSVKIALAGNPNSGKTTLFNALTGSNQFVGNWPGVTVEKKEGKLKTDKNVTIIDLPGIYSLSPYSLEEVVARNYLVNEKPDVILNIVDGTNIERNLYLTTQLLELGIPVVVAANMMDEVEKSGDKINVETLSKILGCKIVSISALKEKGIDEVARVAVEAAAEGNEKSNLVHKFPDEIERALKAIEKKLPNIDDKQNRFYVVKLFERDEKLSQFLSPIPDVEDIIKPVEKTRGDDSESIIANERYNFITSIIDSCYTKNNRGNLSTSDKIDKIVTNRWLAFPIFALVMWLVYYVSVTTVGTIATDWANEGVFGEGWHLFSIGSKEHEEAAAEYDFDISIINSFESEAKKQGINPGEAEKLIVKVEIRNDDNEIIDEVLADFVMYKNALLSERPNPANYGVWIPGIPNLVENGLDSVNTAPWLNSLIIDGIIGGVGAVLGFVPQMLVLFAFLAFLESCGYMSRIAFIMDRIFHKFGLSGKSFIPIIIGTGCSVPGIMASRTIENEHDRKITIITTSFIPCSAKLPVIALIAGALFNKSSWVAPLAYFIGMAAVILSGIILKKTKLFSGEPAPFVMELPTYRWPTIRNILRSMWERGSSFIKKAGTIILLSSIVIWFLSNFGISDGSIVMVDNLSDGFLAAIGGAIAWIFKPLGWGDWKSTVATLTGLVAKENVVGTFGVLYGFGEVSEKGSEIWDQISKAYTPIAGFSFLVFNLLCAPCFAAVGAIRREMNSGLWTIFAVGYQTVLAYAVSLCVYQLGMFITKGEFRAGTMVSFAIILLGVYLIFRPNKKVSKHKI